MKGLTRIEYYEDSDGATQIYIGPLLSHQEICQTIA